MKLFTPVQRNRIGASVAPLLMSALLATVARAQQTPPPAVAPAPTAYAPLGVPAPGPVTDAPYAPQPILPGGIVIPIYAPDSPHLKRERIREAERYNMSRDVPGRIQSIVNIHNPSIEVHLTEAAFHTGTVVILLAGGAHNTLNVGTEGADFVSWFYNYGVTTIILRNRLKSDGYNPLTDEVNDALQAIRLVRAHAAEWKIDPAKIGIIGFSAGAELAASTAVFYEDFDRTNQEPGDPLAKISARPDFVGLVYPGPTPFTRDAATKIPADAPPTFITCAGSGDRQHAVWADTYFAAMLKAGVPNVEMHIYGNGVHADGLMDRNGIPFGTWQDRYIDWFRDLGFLGKPGVETKAAHDVSVFLKGRK
jgi:acetyl esterase/lipase